MLSSTTGNYLPMTLVMILVTTIAVVNGRMRFTPKTEIRLNQAMGASSEYLERMAIVESVKLKRGIDVEENQNETADKHGKYVGRYTARCRDSLLMTPVRASKTLVLDEDLLAIGGVTCHWDIIGTGKCIPEITCKNFSIAEPKPADNDQSEPCQGEFLELRDGTLGWKRYCGTDGPVRVIASRDLRDIYMTLNLTEGANTAKNRTFRCVIRCGSGTVLHEDEHNEQKEMEREITPLPEVGDPLLNAACKCGRKEVVSGSTDGKGEEFPWLTVLVKKDTRQPFCAGTLINDRFVLTAASCFRGEFVNAKQNVEVLLHPHELIAPNRGGDRKMQGSSLVRPKTRQDILREDEDDKSYRFGITKYFIHPLFVTQNKDFDVALVLLDTVMNWKAVTHTSPICIPDVGQYDQSQEGRGAVAAGWGWKGEFAELHLAKSLKKQKVEVFKDSECLAQFDWEFTSRMICAGHRKRDPEEENCTADSGGPLIAERGKSVWEQIGVLSTKEHCQNTTTSPALYIDTRQVAQWIQYVSTLEQAVWCSG